MAELRDYTVRFATAEDVRWMTELQAQGMGQHALPLSTMQQWYSTNPYGFYVAETDSGSRVGCAVVLPIRPEPLRAFVTGIITEKDIQSEHLYLPEERHAVQDLYVSLMMIELSKLTSMHLAFRMLMMIEKMCVPANVRSVYLLTLNSAVDRIVRTMGGRLIGKAAERLDQLNLYRLDFRDSVGRVIRRYQLLRQVVKGRLLSGEGQ